MRSHDHVRVPEPAGRRAVRADAAHLAREVEDPLRTSLVEQALRVVPARQVVVVPPWDDDVVALPLQPPDDLRPEEAATAGDKDSHARARSVVVSQSTRPIHRSRFAAYHLIVREMPSSHDIIGSQPASRFSFSYPTRSAITSLAPGRKRSGTE